MTIISAAQLPDSAAGTRLVREGKLIRLARGIYSDEVRKAPERVIAENWVEILALTVPNAVVTDRSAFAMRPVNGCLFVAADRARNVSLPGLTIVARAGDPAQPGDTPAGHGISIASEHRALVENLTPSRAAGGRPARTLTRSELHDKVVQLVSSRTPEQQARLLASVRDYGAKTGRTEDAESIDVFFESARGERPTVQTSSRRMLAAQSGRPFDSGRVQLLGQLTADLASRQPKVRIAGDEVDDKYLPFFDAYFSNFIEGTEFSVEDAADIALHGRIPAERPEDAHDISGTYRILNDLDEMSRQVESADEFLEVLRHRHETIMEGRPGKRPGLFKIRANRAGMTMFVAPEHVEGTLRAGWEKLAELQNPFARATFMMFLVSLVHPFDDGNGRLARMMMNAELAAAGATQIIIPTVLRNDYMSALSGLTHNARAQGLVDVLDFAQRYTAQVNFSEFERAHQMLGVTNAFVDSTQAERRGVRLILPSTLPLGWESAEPFRP